MAPEQGRAVFDEAPGVDRVRRPSPTTIRTVHPLGNAQSSRLSAMDKVLILDFGSQYTQLIARRVRELKVYSEIHPYSISARRDPRLPSHGADPFGKPRQHLPGGRAEARPGHPGAGDPDPGDLLRPVRPDGPLRGGGVAGGAPRVRAGGLAGGPGGGSLRRSAGNAPRLDEPRGQGRHAPRCLPGAGAHGELALCRDPASGAALLRGAVPPRGHPHPAGEGDPGELLSSGSPSASRPGPCAPSWRAAWRGSGSRSGTAACSAACRGAWTRRLPRRSRTGPSGTA